MDPDVIQIEILYSSIRLSLSLLKNHNSNLNKHKHTNTRTHTHTQTHIHTSSVFIEKVTYDVLDELSYLGASNVLLLTLDKNENMRVPKNL